MSEQGHTEEDLYALAHEIGMLVIEWNLFHETLAKLYISLTTRPNSIITNALSTWTCVRDDRRQRELLLAAATTYDVPSSKLGGDLVAEVTWIVESANAMQDKRNDAVHTPIGLVAWDNGPPRLRTITALDNRRALNLDGQDLLQTFADLRLRLARLHGYAHQMAACMFGLQAAVTVDYRPTPWPTARPTL